jgi:transcriptional regulator with XRE-family HTH domain
MAMRKAAGYRTGKELADALGIPLTTYARYERTSGDPKAGIPLHAAWAMADKLHCSIDDVVGRTAPEGKGRDLNAEYQSLSEESQALMDEYLQYLGLRDRIVAGQGR